MPNTGQNNCFKNASVNVSVRIQYNGDLQVRKLALLESCIERINGITNLLHGSIVPKRVGGTGEDIGSVGGTTVWNRLESQKSRFKLEEIGEKTTLKSLDIITIELLFNVKLYVYRFGCLKMNSTRNTDDLKACSVQSQSFRAFCQSL